MNNIKTWFERAAWSNDPVKKQLAMEAEIADLRAALAAAAHQQQEPFAAPVVKLICPSCGKDRLKEPCPNMADECPMVADAHLLASDDPIGDLQAEARQAKLDDFIASMKPQPVAEQGELPRAVGVSRDAESPGMKGVLVSFERPLSDGELRRLHDLLAASQQAAETLACAAQAARDVEHERLRQITQEGWTPERDDGYERHELGRAAATYALIASMQEPERSVVNSHGNSAVAQSIKAFWPWSYSWLKPKSRRADLVKAGALILAEIERLDRAAMRSNTAAEEKP